MEAAPFVFLFSGGPLAGNTLAGDACHVPTLAGFGAIAYRDTQGGRVGAPLDVVYPCAESLSATSTVRFVLHRYVVSHRTESAGRLEIHVQYFGQVSSVADEPAAMLEDRPERPRRKRSAIAMRQAGRRG